MLGLFWCLRFGMDQFSTFKIRDDIQMCKCVFHGFNCSFVFLNSY